MSLVSCARVGDALTEWLDTASQLKKTALCEALGCGPTNEQIAAVFMNCAGVAHIPGESIPSCDEMDAAISAAIEAIFTGGTDGQVWTKAADGTQGWADVRVSEDAGNIIELRGDGLFAGTAIPECEVVPSLWELLTAQEPDPSGPSAMEYGHVSAVVKLGEIAVSGGTSLGVHFEWDDDDGLEIVGGEIVLPALPSAPTGLTEAGMVLEVYPFASGQQVGIFGAMIGLVGSDRWGPNCTVHVTNLTSGEAFHVPYILNTNGPDYPLAPPGFFNDTDTYCLNVSFFSSVTG